MSAGAKVTVKLNSPAQIKRARGLEKNGLAQRFFVHEVRRLADAYVPWDKGPLKETAIEDSHSITYVQPYASDNYYENSGHGKEGTARGGKRGKLWDKRMWADRGDEIIDSVAAYAGGRRAK